MWVYVCLAKIQLGCQASFYSMYQQESIYIQAFFIFDVIVIISTSPEHNTGITSLLAAVISVILMFFDVFRILFTFDVMCILAPESKYQSFLLKFLLKHTAENALELFVFVF